ncbi:flippase [Jejubacter calystegiae]|uniref:Putative O-antigen transporter n=1 Tax=Jejubacter calystegiae TaxID=2579935 RepID=A0A4P8YP53_9ENTR|nr:flippase [Jejubacter calystegiae]QCT22033.1 flippase [Jejubacter calystegiae]
MSLIKNSGLNIGGYIIPTLIAIPALGFLSRSLGSEQFGIFTLAMAIVGYASIFDVGMTRSVIREISIYRDNEQEKNKIISTALIVVMILGCIGSLVMSCSASFISEFLKISVDLKSSVVSSLKILSLAIPIFLVNQVLLAFLEGEEKFLNINIQKLISSSFLAGLPALLVFIFNHSLSYAISGLLLGRVLALFVNVLFSLSLLRKIGLRFYKENFIRLVKFGGWITVSNIISPLMSYFDRFIVSNLQGAHLVAFYSAPSEGVTRLSIIPGALSRAIFPKLSYAKNYSDRQRQINLGYKLLLGVCIPIVIVGIVFSQQILTIWLGKEYAGISSDIFQVLLIGFLFNSVAQIPFATIQALGKAKVTACLHLAEVTPYLLLLYILIAQFGILGAAYAWTARMFCDMTLLQIISRRIMKKDTRH